MVFHDFEYTRPLMPAEWFGVGVLSPDLRKKERVAHHSLDVIG